MKKTLLLLSALALIFTMRTNAQIINSGFETWSADMLVPSAMNPNSGNNTFGWWDYNYFNSSFVGSSPISVTRCTDTVHGGTYSVRLETKAYTPTSWNIYKSWGIPFIGHEYNDTLGILFNGKVNVTDQTFLPGTACNQNLTQFKFYYQYRPNGSDIAECRVALLHSGALVAGGSFQTSVATGTSGWQQAVINFTYVSGLTPDTLQVLFSSSSLDNKPKAGSVMWIDDVSVSLATGVEQMVGEESSMQVFPNPSNGLFSIKHENNQALMIEIFNLIGEKIYSVTKDSNAATDIDISHAPKGVYFVKISDGENDHIEKIVVQ
jgi:hypothetical protein